MKALRHKQTKKIVNVSYSIDGLKWTTDSLGRNLYYDKDYHVYDYNYMFHKAPYCPYVWDKSGRKYLKEDASPEQIAEWRNYTDNKSAEQSMKQKARFLELGEDYDPNFQYNPKLDKN